MRRLTHLLLARCRRVMGKATLIQAALDGDLRDLVIDVVGYFR